MKLVTIIASTFGDIKQIREEYAEDVRSQEDKKIVFESESIPRIFKFLDENDVSTEEVTVEDAEDWPRKGVVAVGNDSIDNVEVQGDFADLEERTQAYQGLSRWLSRIRIEIELGENGEVRVEEVNP